MDTTSHRRYVPFCETRIHPADQYMFPEVDTTERTCQNGVSHPIYSCRGEISRTLPLTMYPKVNEIHPQIFRSSQPHFGVRDPAMARMVEMDQLDKARGRIEGFYVDGGEYDPYRVREAALAQRHARK
jgi:hypothetical protein